MLVAVKGTLLAHLLFSFGIPIVFDLGTDVDIDT